MKLEQSRVCTVQLLSQLDPIKFDDYLAKSQRVLRDLLDPPRLQRTGENSLTYVSRP